MRPAEVFAMDWMEDLAQDGAVSEENLLRMREQLITVYGLERNGKSTERDRYKIDHRLGLLSLLVADNVSIVDQARSEEFAYDFVHLVWKEAEADNKAFEADKERRRLHELATHDPLTGLLNRRGLAEDLDDMIGHVRVGHWEGLALLYLDLDHFKQINDTPGLGHRVGDQVLTGVARILESRTRKPGRGGPADVIARPHSAGEPERLAPDRATPAEQGAEAAGADTEEKPEAESVRMGGDEFVLLLPYGHAEEGDLHPSRRNTSLTMEERTAAIAGRLATAITEFMNRHTNGQVDGLGVSIGCVLWREGMTADEFILEGDHNMYEVKRDRKDQAATTRPSEGESGPANA